MRAIEAIALSPDVDPWDRQPGETVGQHNQFVTYLNMGTERKLSTFAAQTGRNASNVRVLAKAMHWAERAAAQDADNRHINRVVLLAEGVSAARDDAKILKAFRVRIAQYINKTDWEALEFKDFMRMVEITLRQGRMLFGNVADIAAAGDGTGSTDSMAAEVAAWAELTPAARADRMRDLTRQADARLAALSGLDDE